MRKIIAVILLGISSYASADELVFHLTSAHLDNKNWNRANYGVGYIIHDYTFGIYNNSEGNTSNYVGWRDQGKFFNVTWGIVTGYEDYPIPVVVPEFSFKMSRRVSLKSSIIMSVPIAIGTSIAYRI